TRAAQPVGQAVPVVPIENEAEVGYRDLVAVDRVGQCVTGFAFAQMRGDLVAVEIEIDPVVAFAAFVATERVAVKMPGGFEVADRKGKMKGAVGHGCGGSWTLRNSWV